MDHRRTYFDHYSPNHSRDIAESHDARHHHQPIMGFKTKSRHPRSLPASPLGLRPLIRRSAPAPAAADVFEQPSSHAPRRLPPRQRRQKPHPPASWAQSTLPGIFGFQLIAGTAKALDDPNSVLLSQSTAIALFGNTAEAIRKAIGTTIRINSNESRRVGGIFADLPANTSWHDEAEVILSWNSEEIAWAKPE